MIGTLSIVVAFGIAPTLVSFVAQVGGYGADIRVPLTAIGLVTSIAGVASCLLAMRAARSSSLPSLPTPTALPRSA